VRVVFVQDVFVDELFSDEQLPTLPTLPLGVSNSFLLLFELYIKVVSLLSKTDIQRKISLSDELSSLPLSFTLCKGQSSGS